MIADRGPALITVSVLFTTIAFFTTVLRLWVRRKRRALGWDDHTIAVAMMLTVIEAAITITAVTRGKGRPSASLSKSDKEFINMYSWYAQLVLFAAMASVKISVCLLMTRIKHSSQMKWLAGCIISILVIAALEVIIVLLAQCQPISLYWRSGPGTCWPTEVRIYSIYAQAGISIITDLICSLLPIIITRDIQLPTRRKVSIWVLMALGLICTACSAVRAKTLNSKAKDIAYEYSAVAIWAMTELCLGIIATNLALSRSVYHYYLGNKPLSPNDNGLSHVYWRPAEGESRSSSMTKNGASDIPLKPAAGVEETTEVEIDAS